MKKKWMNGSVSGSKKTSNLSAGGIAAGRYYFNRPSCAADEVVRHRRVCAFGHDNAALCAADGRMRKKYDIGTFKEILGLWRQKRFGQTDAQDTL